MGVVGGWVERISDVYVGIPPQPNLLPQGEGTGVMIMVSAVLKTDRGNMIATSSDSSQ
jgi:hypothetical protein